MTITITEQLEFIDREIRLRRRVYSRWVEERRMTQVEADRVIRTMEAVAETLRGLGERLL